MTFPAARLSCLPKGPITSKLWRWQSSSKSRIQWLKVFAFQEVKCR
jgi:hypothetical protein